MPDERRRSAQRPDGRPGARRLLFLAKYTRRAASTRFRFEQYFPSLEAAGFECVLSPLLGDRYLDARLDEGRTDLAAVAAGYVRRLMALPRVRRYDAVVLYQEALPYLPAFYEAWLRRLGVPYVYDCDDATFHAYDLHPRAALRAVLGRKIGRIITGASLVMAGNAYLAEYAARFNRHVDVVPTVVDTGTFTPGPARPPGGEVTVGWIGSPSTASYLRAFVEAWQRAIVPGRARLVLVGSGPVDLGATPVTVVPWSEATEVAAVQGFDIGIMPLLDDPWSRGKCGFKLIEYMACGVPAIASPVGANARIVDHGRTGYLCSNVEEWTIALQTLIARGDIRRQFGEAARAAAVADWSLARWAPRVVAHLTEVAARRCAA